MKLLLADADIQGHVDRLVKRMQGEPWLEFWEYLQITYASFADLGLDPADSDVVVWKRCQEKQAFLITGNRNDDGPDSLEATICTRQHVAKPSRIHDRRRETDDGRS